jgi:hypothetical protein
MLSVFSLNVIKLSVIMLNVIKLSVIMLNVIMLNVVMLNVIMLNVVAPTKGNQIFIILQFELIPKISKQDKIFELS